jgi:anthranilate synthase component 2
MKTLIIDNYDSFTYNLYQYVGELGGNPVVFRNDEITIAEIEEMGFDHIIISPGPGHPGKKEDFGICGEVIEHFGKTIPVLGVCLGHQGISLIFGGDVVRAPEIMHGKTSEMTQLTVGDLNSPNILKDLDERFEAMRYHSLVADRDRLPNVLKVTAETDDKLVMAVQHEEFPIYGIQFHPESIGTEVGKTILKSFLNV